MNPDQEKLREALAAYAHKAWSGWMQYMFSKSQLACNRNSIIPKEFADRWTRQAKTKYIDLPESEKKSDREEADRMIRIFELADKVVREAADES